MSSRKSVISLPVLGIVLGLQLVLAGTLFWGSQEPVVAVNEPLVKVGWESVDAVEIDGEDEASLTLKKEGDQWLTSDGLPVVSVRIESLLSTLAELETGWPVASSESAAERFEVANDRYKRKIKLYGDEQPLGAILVGTSPGFNQSHVRLPGEDDIFALKLSVFDAPAEVDTWLDTKLLRPEGEVLGITYRDHLLEKKDGKWPPAPGQEQSEDGDAVADDAAPRDQERKAEDAFDPAKFSAALRDLRVAGLAENIAALDASETENATENEQMIVVTKWKIRTDKSNYDYELLKKGDQHYIRRSDYPHTFRLSQTHFDSLVTIKNNRFGLASR